MKEGKKHREERQSGKKSGDKRATGKKEQSQKEQSKKQDEDDENVDWWREPDFSSEMNPTGLMEKSEFRIMFPSYRAEYIQELWPRIVQLFETHHLQCDLDLVAKTMEVATTRKTYDPFIIIRARDLLRLVARSVPLHQAKRILEPTTFCDIIKIGGVVRNKERFARRRQRLVGPSGSTLKVIELLTECYVCVSGQTVCALGPWQGIRKVRDIALGCMNNVHPVYNLKTLMVKNELAKKEEMRGESWDRYLPKFIKTHKKKRKAKV